jgi:hypothetical protein
MAAALTAAPSAIWERESTGREPTASAHDEIASLKKQVQMG